MDEVRVVPPAADIEQHAVIAVTSCEEDSDEGEDNYGNDTKCLDEKDSTPPQQNQQQQQHQQQPEDLFDDRADEDDEAYVYQHLRSGVEEFVKVKEHDSSSPGVKRPPLLKVLKPRNSDAVLSCPCCFTIVCMDCQQHERFKNLYRAMFVQSIAVRWDLRLRYDDTQRLLLPQLPVADAETTTTTTNRLDGTASTSTTVAPVVVEESKSIQRESDDTIYYTVCCVNCHTVVASLDMNDEIYYFSNCLVSS